MTPVRDLTNGNITKHLLYLTTPLIIGNILQQLYNTVDAFILGHFSGSLEFAAVGIAGSVMNLFLFMITGACSGISVIFAQFYGANDTDAFRREHFLSLIFGSIATIICSLLGLFILPLLLKMIKTPTDLTPLVKDYLRIILLGMPAAFLYNLYGSLLRAIGRANAALYALSIAVLTNLFLDYYFISILHLGIKGAAFATTCSQAVAAILCIIYLRIKNPTLIFTRGDCCMDHQLLKKTAHFSFLTGLHQSSLYIGKLFVQGAVNTGGTDLISAYTATTRIEGFANSFGDSGCTATSILTAQNLGAGKKDRVQKTFRCSLIVMLVLGLVMSTIMYLSANVSARFMLGETSEAALHNAVSYLQIIALFYTLCFLGNTFAGYFEGIGRVAIPFIGAASHIALRGILSWIFIGDLGLSAVALATGLGWLFVNILWLIIKFRTQPEYKSL